MSRLNREGYEKLIAGDLEWLRSLPRTLEREHVILIVEQSVDMYYREDLVAETKILLDRAHVAMKRSRLNWRAE